MTAERLERLFVERSEQGRAVLVAYLCVGHPNVEETVACALAALDAGADALELGVPFSDPTADGPVIAAASYRAIRHGGSLASALDVARKVRAKSDAPIVLFGYYNPIMTWGDAKLPRDAADAGVDALLVVDLPPEEGVELRDAADASRLAVIPLLTPTSGSDRELAALERASGFVYYVSMTGVTGAGDAPLVEAGEAAAALRERAKLPVVVGFGIDSAEKARTVKEKGADGVVVGTAIVRAIDGAETPEGRVAAVRSLVAELRRGLDG